MARVTSPALRAIVALIAVVLCLLASQHCRVSSMAAGPIPEAEKWNALSAVMAQSASSGSPSAELVPATLRAQDVFPAFGGVLCLVFKGFPRPIEQLKGRLDAAGPSALGPAWAKENMGSKWAKVTLAAVRDEVAPDSYDASALAPKLRAVCESFRVKLGKVEIPVTTLSAVRFTTRDLAKTLQVLPVPVAPAADGAELSDATVAVTQEVLGDFFGDGKAEAYCVEHLQRRRTSASRYLEAVDPPMHTLVTYLRDSPDAAAVAALHEVLAEFRTEVDALVGDSVFKWFDADALHCTIRGL
jgi:hypothetical protein